MFGEDLRTVTPQDIKKALIGVDYRDAKICLT